MATRYFNSPFLLEKINTAKQKNSRYINDLCWLYRIMQKQRLSPMEGQVYFLLRNKYQNEYMDLLKEKDPVKYQVYIEEQKITEAASKSFMQTIAHQ